MCVLRHRIDGDDPTDWSKRESKGKKETKIKGNFERLALARSSASYMRQCKAFHVGSDVL